MSSSAKNGRGAFGEDGEPVRVAIYTRISTDEERQPNSLEAQRVRLDAFVESQPGWTVERRYEDQFTGTVIDRPALTKLLRDAKLARFDVLLVYRVDRLARLTHFADPLPKIESRLFSEDV